MPLTIEALVAWLLPGSSGCGLGVLGWWLVNVIARSWPWFDTLRYDLKRVLSFLIVGLFAVVAGAAVLIWAAWLGLRALPATPQEWNTVLFGIAAAAIMTSQAAHGVQQARASDV